MEQLTDTSKLGSYVWVFTCVLYSMHESTSSTICCLKRQCHGGFAVFGS